MTQKELNTQSETAHVEDLKKEIETLKRDMLHLTQSLEKMGKEKLKKTVDEAKERITSKIPKERLEQMETVRKQGEDALEAIKTQQREHPIGTLLVAIAVGFLLGKVLSSGKE